MRAVPSLSFVLPPRARSQRPKRSAYQMTTATTVSCSTLPIKDTRDAPVASAEMRYAIGISAPAIRSRLFGTRRVPLLNEPMAHASVAVTVRMIARSIFAPAMLAHATGMKKKGRSAQRRITGHRAIFSDMPEFCILVSEAVYHARSPSAPCPSLVWKKLSDMRKRVLVGLSFHFCAISRILSGLRQRRRRGSHVSGMNVAIHLERLSAFRRHGLA